MATDEVLARAVAAHKRKSKKPVIPVESPEEDPPIYAMLVEKFGDPTGPLVIKAEQLSRRAVARRRQQSGKLTAMVWNSLNPDGTVDPRKWVAGHLVTTQEFEQISKRPTQEEAASD
jgi:hypothetical protein